MLSGRLDVFQPVLQNFTVGITGQLRRGSDLHQIWWHIPSKGESSTEGSAWGMWSSKLPRC